MELFDRLRRQHVLYVPFSTEVHTRLLRLEAELFGKKNDDLNFGDSLTQYRWNVPSYVIFFANFIRFLYLGHDYLRPGCTFNI